MSDGRVAARILGTGSVLPGRAYDTAELVDRLGWPREKIPRIEEKTGIRQRYWAEKGAKLAPFAADAVRRALDAAGLAPEDLKRIILVRAGSGDLIFPATANRVASALGLRSSCDCFDVNNACLGFLTGLDLAARSIATGLGPVAVVSAEMCSRGIRPEDYRPYLVFGDAVAAAILGPARQGEGILASYLANDGSLPDDVYAAEPSITDRREYIQFAKTSAEIFEIAFRAMAAGVHETLRRAEVPLSDVEWVLPHQPNGFMVDLVIQHLGIAPERVVRVVQDIGSVASASIPVSLDRLMRTRPVRPGDRILMAGVGGGVSYGSMLYRVGGDA
jgi:3-oxoacyl-(acyl-carrier-protein) synthase III